METLNSSIIFTFHVIEKIYFMIILQTLYRVCFFCRHHWVLVLPRFKASWVLRGVHIHMCFRYEEHDYLKYINLSSVVISLKRLHSLFALIGLLLFY